MVRDAVWLALVVHRSADAATGEWGEEASGGAVVGTRLDGGASGQAEDVGLDGRDGSPADGPGADVVEVFPTATTPDMVQGSGRRASPIRLSSPTPLPDTLSLTRALRPYRRARRPSRDLALDVEATIRATAEAQGELQPVFRPQSEPRFAAHLVVDESPSMTAWDDAMQSFELILRRSSSFRDVSRWRLGPTGDEALVVTRQGRTIRPPWLGVQDDNIVVLATDGRGVRWREERWWAELRRWCRGALVSILNPLPPTWWGRGAFPADVVRIHAQTRSTTNLALTAALPRTLRRRPDVPDVVPVPVLMLEPGELDAWSRTIASADPSGCIGVMVLDRPPEGRTSQVVGRDAVEGFRGLATKWARRLAVVLSTCDAHTIDTMRIVQRDLVPDSTPDDLAQVLAGGFLDSEPSDRGYVYRFHPDAQAELHSELLAEEAYAVHRSIGAALERRSGSGSALGWVSDPEGDYWLPPGAQALAEARQSALESAGFGRRRSSASAVLVDQPDSVIAVDPPSLEAEIGPVVDVGGGEARTRSADSQAGAAEVLPMRPQRLDRSAGRDSGRCRGTNRGHRRLRRAPAGDSIRKHRG